MLTIVWKKGRKEKRQKEVNGKVLDQYGELKTENETSNIKPCVCYPQSDLEIALLD